MNYIFLDIDGVLNYNDFVFEYIDDTAKIVDLNNVQLLAYIVEKTKAKIILSSSWRYGFDDSLQPTFPNGGCQILLDILKEHGMKLHDRTETKGDSDNGYRPGQIEQYINRHLKDTDNFIILDDETWGDSDPNGMDIFGRHFIRTDWDKRGLSSEDATRAVLLLTSPDYNVAEWRKFKEKLLS